jgi:hypothetical protein
MNISFKIEPNRGRYRSFAKELTTVKVDGSNVGTISQEDPVGDGTPAKYKIRLKLKDGDPFRWATVKHRFDNAEDARQWAKDNLEKFQDKLHVSLDESDNGMNTSFKLGDLTISVTYDRYQHEQHFIFSHEGEQVGGLVLEGVDENAIFSELSQIKSIADLRGMCQRRHLDVDLSEIFDPETEFYKKLMSNTAEKAVMAETTDDLASILVQHLLSEEDEDSDVGDQVVVADNGKSYIGVVAGRNPDGSLKISFGAQKPSTQRPYKKDEVRRTKKLDPTKPPQA